MVWMFVVGVHAGLSVVFAAASVSKLRPRSVFGEFVEYLGQVGIAPRLRRAAAAVFVVAEALVAVALLLPWPVVALAAAVAMLTIFTLVTAWLVRRRRKVACRCFSSAGGVLSWIHVARDAALLVLAGLALGAEIPWRSPGPDIGEIIVGATAGAACAALVTHLDDLISLFTSTSPAGALQEEVK